MIKNKQIGKKAYQKRYLFTPDARTGWKIILKTLKTSLKRKILLPSYIGINKKEGSGVFDPINETQTGYVFYKVRGDLSVDLEDFRKKIRRPDIVGALLIHYFGFPTTNLPGIVRLCKKHKKALIEDCAHTLSSTLRGKMLGTFGDFSFYSLHKVLSSNSGGYVRFNSAATSPDMDDNISKDDLLCFVKSDLSKISRKRRSNYAYFLKHIQKIKGVKPVYPKLPKGTVPLNFPVIIQKKNRDNVYFALRALGIEVVSLYYCIIKEISKKEFPTSYFISNHIMNFPLHEEITQKNILEMCKSVKEVLAEP